MKSRTLLLSALVALTGLAGNLARAESMATIAITPATGQVTLIPRWAIGGGLAVLDCDGNLLPDLYLGNGGLSLSRSPAGVATCGLMAEVANNERLRNFLSRFSATAH